jgi:hypothetical protein
MGLLADLQKAFAYRLKPSQMVGWMDAVSAAIDTCVPYALVQVKFQAGAPVVTLVTTRVAGVTTATFTPTDNADGDTTITWPSGTFPSGGVDPQATSVASLGSGSSAEAIRAANSARIITVFFPSAALHDCDFVLSIFGD